MSVPASEPQIKRHPSNLTQLLGSKAVLPCVTLGNPRPDVTWLKDDEMIKVGLFYIPFPDSGPDIGPVWCTVLRVWATVVQ